VSCRTICSHKINDCPYQQARRAAARADIVVTNHALLTQSDGIRADSHIIIDEAHHLEEAAREASRIDLTEHRVAELVAPFLKLGKGKMQSPVVSRPRAGLLLGTEAEAKEVVRDYQRLVASCIAFAESRAADGPLRLTVSIRKSPAWQRIVQQGERLTARCKFLIGLLEGAAKPRSEAAASATGEAIYEVKRFSSDLDRFLKGSPDRIQWIEGEELYDVALSIKEAIQAMSQQAKSLVLTSATLTTNGSFTFMQSRLGLLEATAVQFGSSFDYRKQMLIFIIDDGPLPNDPAFASFTSEKIRELALTLTGRLLGLFTSHESVKRTYYDTLKELNKANIRLLAQKITGGRHNIAARFKKQPASVLLGTYSFWEGIDVPGESLSCVVVGKLPFTVPTDPIRVSIAEAERLSMFRDISVPEMILRLRQGIGRLIRSASDTGVVVILDGRFLRAEYGDAVLKSLPPAQVHIGSRTDLIREVTRWFGEETLTRWKKAGET
jgi:DNA polymerase-3 subunit epsilon/ATP-dependent DNA helicase DinG